MFMEAYIEHFGYFAVLIGTLLEGETVLLLGGFAAHRGYLDISLVVLSAFIGTVCGDQLFYYFGRRHSHAVLHHRPGWEVKIEHAQSLIDRHKILIILTFRFLYGLRTVIPFTLGAAGVPFRIFAPLNILGAIIWSLGVGCAGYLFGQVLEMYFSRLKEVEILIMAGIALIGGVVWILHFLHLRKNS